MAKNYPIKETMTTTSTPTLTTAQAAAHIGCNVTWIVQLLGEGRIKGTKDGRRWQVDAASLDAYIDRGPKKRGPEERPPTRLIALDAPLTDEERGGYQYGAALNLVYAILELATGEAVSGDLPAQLWIESPESDHWFQWANIDPAMARAAIKRQRPKGHPDIVRIERAIALHNRGLTWKEAFLEVFGYYSETLRYRVERYAEVMRTAGVGD